MIEPNTSTNIRIKKSFPMENKFMKTSTGLVQTRYSEPFGKFFFDKNKQRINQVDGSTKTNKYSGRYLVNLNKLQKLNDKQNQKDRQRPQLNRTLSNSVNDQEFNITAPMFKYNSTTSQSHRSHIMTVNLKQLPRLQPSSSNFNGSHNKVQALRQDMNEFGMQVINLSTRTNDFKITFDRTKINIQNHCNQVEKNLNFKVLELQKLIKNVHQENKYRSQRLKNDCLNIKQKNMQLKQYLQQIERKIQGIQNVLGITTGHHKHYV